MLPSRTISSPDALVIDGLDIEDRVQIADVDHLPVISKIGDELDLTAVVDETVAQDPQQAMSTGLAVTCSPAPDVIRADFFDPVVANTPGTSGIVRALPG